MFFVCLADVWLVIGAIMVLYMLNNPDAVDWRVVLGVVLIVGHIVACAACAYALPQGRHWAWWLSSRLAALWLLGGVALLFIHPVTLPVVLTAAFILWFLQRNKSLLYTS